MREPIGVVTDRGYNTASGIWPTTSTHGLVDLRFPLKLRSRRHPRALSQESDAPDVSVDVDCRSRQTSSLPRISVSKCWTIAQTATR
jgi:hypothetical protein